MFNLQSNRQEIVAKNHAADHNYSHAFEMYCNLFGSCEMEKIRLTTQLCFSEVVIKLAAICEEVQEHEQAIVVYKTALGILPRNAFILNALGAYLARLSIWTEARYYLDTCISEHPFHLPAQRNLNHLTWLLLDRWFFRMLNDRKRNGAYHSAISKAIHSASNQNVYDLGCGSGLLSLIALDAGAKTVVAFEQNDTLCGIFKGILELLQLEQNVKLIEQNSNDVDLCSSGMPECNLLIAEIFDCALFGEHAITTLLHAQESLTMANEYRIVPKSAQCFIGGISNKKLSKKWRFQGTLFDREMCITRLGKSYECENIFDSLQSGDSVMCLPPQPLMPHFLLFDDVVRLQQLTHSEVFGTVTFVSDQTCEIDALVVYFDLNLDDMHTITTNPMSNDCCSCWGNAVFPLEHSLPLKCGDTVVVTGCLLDNKLHVTFKEDYILCNCNQHFQAPKEVISLLNDTGLLHFYDRTAEQHFKAGITVLDSNTFPYLGLTAAQKQAKCVYIVSSEQTTHLIEYIVRSLNLSNIKIISAAEYSDVDLQVDFRFDNVVDCDGSWVGISEINCPITTIQLPTKIILNCRLVEWPYLDYCNKVSDDNVFGYPMSQFLNEYTGTEHVHLQQLDGVVYLSNEVAMDISVLDKFDYEEIVNAVTRGCANGVLYWFTFLNSDCSTYSTHLNHNGGHYGMSAKLLKNPRPIRQNERIMLKVQKMFDYININI